MNQAQLVDAISAHHANTGVSKVTIKFVLDALAEITQKTIKAGGEVTIPGIAKLTVKTRAARTGRNPSTGEALALPEKKVPHLSALKALKDAVAD